MAISDKLNYLIETKSKFKDRLNSLGAEIIESTTFRNYLTWLDTFYGEVSDKTDLSVNGVVGRTSQETTTGKNLQPPPTSKTTYGVTFTSIFENGMLQYVNANGTSTGIAYIDLPEFRFGAGTYIITGSPSGGSNDSYQQRFVTSNSNLGTDNGDGISVTLNTATSCRIRIRIASGYTANNLKFYPMVRLASITDATYEPYTGRKPSPSPDYPQEINNLSGDVEYKVRGKNILDKYSNLFQGTFLTATGGDDSIDSSTMFKCCTKKIDISNLSGDITCSGGYFELFAFYDENNNLLSYVQNSTATIPNGTKNVRVRFFGGSTEIPLSTLQELDLMVENNSTATSYEPYISESFPLSLKSRNKFNKNTIINGYVNAGGGITNLDGYKSSAYIEIKPNTSYYKSQSGSTRWKYYDENKTVYSSKTTDLSNASDEQIFITPSNVKYLRFTMSNDLVGSFILCEGSTPTDYEPYYDINLCNISDYKDRIYSQNGEFYLEKKTDKVVLDGSENWTLGSASSNDYYAFQKNGVLNNANESTIYCDNFANIGYQSASAVNDFECVSLNASSLVNSYLRIWIKGSRLSGKTASAFKTWLSTHNTEVQYVLATPTTTEITEENYPTLYSQLLAIQEFLTKYKINKEFLLDYSSPEIEY